MKDTSFRYFGTNNYVPENCSIWSIYGMKDKENTIILVAEVVASKDQIIASMDRIIATKDIIIAIAEKKVAASVRTDYILMSAQLMRFI